MILLPSASWLAHQKAYLQNMGKMPEIAYYDTLGVTMAQYNYRSRPQTEELLNEIDPQKAYGYYKNLFSDASGFTFYFVGNIDMKTLKPMVEFVCIVTLNRSAHDLERFGCLSSERHDREEGL